MAYIKPIALQLDDMAEGIYASSGSGCYTVTARIHQRPETGRNDFRIQVNAQHRADHTRTTQYLTISFNSPVHYIGCYINGATLMSGDNTNTLKIKLSYYQNPTDNIGGGDLVVYSDNPLLEIVSCSLTD